jgi:hypothetical protein
MAAIRFPSTPPCRLGTEYLLLVSATSDPFFRSQTLASWIWLSVLVNWIEYWTLYVPAAANVI